MDPILSSILSDPNVSDAFKDGVKAGEAKHTPGPWSVEKPDQFQGHKFIPVEVPGKIICEVYGSDDDFLKVTAVDHANARLIAAAPELLAGLSDTLRMLEAAHRQLGMHSADNPRIVKAKAACALAMGAMR